MSARSGAIDEPKRIASRQRHDRGLRIHSGRVGQLVRWSSTAATRFGAGKRIALLIDHWQARRLVGVHLGHPPRESAVVHPQGPGRLGHASCIRMELLTILALILL
jgi:hypothetical protein